MFRIDMKGPNPPRPELLLHGMLPPSVWGKAPRVKMGQEKWDEVRGEAYTKAAGNCMACGEPAGDPLEAHETYKNGEWGEIVALCKDCHGFIHIGYTISAKPISEAKRIYRRGVAILVKAGLEVPNISVAMRTELVTKRHLSSILAHNRRVYKRQHDERNLEVRNTE